MIKIIERFKIIIIITVIECFIFSQIGWCFSGLFNDSNYVMPKFNSSSDFSSTADPFLSVASSMDKDPILLSQSSEIDSFSSLPEVYLETGNFFLTRGHRFLYEIDRSFRGYIEDIAENWSDVGLKIDQLLEYQHLSIAIGRLFNPARIQYSMIAAYLLFGYGDDLSDDELNNLHQEAIHLFETSYEIKQMINAELMNNTDGFDIEEYLEGVFEDVLQDITCETWEDGDLIFYDLISENGNFYITIDVNNFNKNDQEYEYNLSLFHSDDGFPQLIFTKNIELDVGESEVEISSAISHNLGIWNPALAYLSQKFNYIETLRQEDGEWKYNLVFEEDVDDTMQTIGELNIDYFNKKDKTIESLISYEVSSPNSDITHEGRMFYIDDLTRMQLWIENQEKRYLIEQEEGDDFFSYKKQTAAELKYDNGKPVIPEVIDDILFLERNFILDEEGNVKGMQEDVISFNDPEFTRTETKNIILESGISMEDFLYWVNSLDTGGSEIEEYVEEGQNITLFLNLRGTGLSHFSQIIEQGDISSEINIEKIGNEYIGFIEFKSQGEVLIRFDNVLTEDGRHFTVKTNDKSIERTSLLVEDDQGNMIISNLLVTGSPVVGSLPAYPPDDDSRTILHNGAHPIYINTEAFVNGIDIPLELHQNLHPHYDEWEDAEGNAPWIIKSLTKVNGEYVSIKDPESILELLKNLSDEDELTYRVRFYDSSAQPPTPLNPWIIEQTFKYEETDDNQAKLSLVESQIYNDNRWQISERIKLNQEIINEVNEMKEVNVRIIDYFFSEFGMEIFEEYLEQRKEEVYDLRELFLTGLWQYVFSRPDFDYGGDMHDKMIALGNAKDSETFAEKFIDLINFNLPEETDEITLPKSTIISWYFRWLLNDDFGTGELIHEIESIQGIIRGYFENFKDEGDNILWNKDVDRFLAFVFAYSSVDSILKIDNPYTEYKGGEFDLGNIKIDFSLVESFEERRGADYIAGMHKGKIDSYSTIVNASIGSSGASQATFLPTEWEEVDYSLTYLHFREKDEVKELIEEFPYDGGSSVWDLLSFLPGTRVDPSMQAGLGAEQSPVLRDFFRYVVDPAAIGSAAVLGAKAGSAIGSIVPGVGNLVGGAIGGLVGGLAGLATGFFGNQGRTNTQNENYYYLILDRALREKSDEIKANWSPYEIEQAILNLFKHQYGRRYEFFLELYKTLDMEDAGKHAHDSSRQGAQDLAEYFKRLGMEDAHNLARQGAHQYLAEIYNLYHEIVQTNYMPSYQPRTWLQIGFQSGGILATPFVCGLSFVKGKGLSSLDSTVNSGNIFISQAKSMWKNPNIWARNMLIYGGISAGYSMVMGRISGQSWNQIREQAQFAYPIGLFLGFVRSFASIPSSVMQKWPEPFKTFATHKVGLGGYLMKQSNYDLFKWYATSSGHGAAAAKFVDRIGTMMLTREAINRTLLSAFGDIEDPITLTGISLASMVIAITLTFPSNFGGPAIGKTGAKSLSGEKYGSWSASDPNKGSISFNRGHFTFDQKAIDNYPDLWRVAQFSNMSRVAEVIAWSSVPFAFERLLSMQD